MNKRQNAVDFWKDRKIDEHVAVKFVYILRLLIAQTLVNKLVTILFFFFLLMYVTFKIFGLISFIFYLLRCMTIRMYFSRYYFNEHTKDLLMISN